MSCAAANRSDKSTELVSFGFITWRLLYLMSSCREAVGAKSLIEAGSGETRKGGKGHSYVIVLRIFAVKRNREIGCWLEK